MQWPLLTDIEAACRTYLTGRKNELASTSNS